jgi:DNA-binding MarR family transcriptional regulator
MTPPMRSISDVLMEDSDELANRISASAEAAALANLRYAAADLTRAEQQRNTLIVLARSVGCSLRGIAEATGLSPQGISKILKRISP